MKEMNEKLRKKVLELVAKLVPKEKNIQATVVALSCSAIAGHDEFKVGCLANSRL